MNTPFYNRPYFWYGIYYGATSIALFTLIYLFSFEFFGRFILWGLTGLAVMVTYLILSGLAERRERGGYIKYWEAFRVIYLTGLIGYLLNLAFTILFVNVIDTEFNAHLGEIVKESTMEWMENMGTPQDRIDTQIAQMDQQFEDANSVMNYGKQLIGAVIMAAVFALICSFFVKRNPPDNFSDSTVLDSEG